MKIKILKEAIEKEYPDSEITKPRGRHYKFSIQTRG